MAWIDGLPGSKLSIFKWLPANRAPMGFPATASDKTPGLVVGSTLGSPRHDRNSPTRWIPGPRLVSPEKIPARWQQIAGATPSLD
jgi:hypothetical protein